MLDKMLMFAMLRSEVDKHHNVSNLVNEVVWKNDTAKTWDEAYENYVQWYKRHYTKLGQALK